MQIYSRPQQTKSRKAGKIASYDPSLKTILLSTHLLILINTNFITHFYPYFSHLITLTTTIRTFSTLYHPFRFHRHRIDRLSYRLFRRLIIFSYNHPSCLSHFLTIPTRFIRLLIRIFIKSWILGSLSCRMLCIRLKQCRLWWPRRGWSQRVKKIQNGSL